MAKMQIQGDSGYVQEINSDGSINTQLTGSIATSNPLGDGFTVTAGSNVETGLASVEDYVYMALALVSNENIAHSFKASVKWFTKAETNLEQYTAFSTDVINVSGGKNGTAEIRLRSQYYRIRVINSDVSDHTYNLAVTLMRS